MKKCKKISASCPSFRRALPWAAAVLLAAGALGAFHVSGKLFPSKWLLGLAWIAPWIIFLKRRCSAETYPTRAGSEFRPLTIMLIGLLLLLFSSAATHKWFFFLNWTSGKNEYIGLPYRMAVFVALTLFLIPLMQARRGRALRWAGFIILIAAQAMCFRALLEYTGGQALSRDDHPSMMFRLWEVSKTWPQMLNYIPYWNAGVVHYTGMAAGLNGLGTLLKPVLLNARIDEVYTSVIGTAFIVAVPLLALLSVRLLGGRGSALWAAGILALGVSQHFFLWLLQYGTVGACFSTAFIMPFSACVFRVLWLRQQTWWLMVLMLTSFIFLLMWPPGAIMAATVFLAAVVNARRWSWKRVAYLAAAGMIGVGLLYKTIGLLYFEGGHEFFHHMLSPGSTSASAATDTPAIDLAQLWKQGWIRLVSHMHEMNPVIVMLGILGAFVFPRRSIRWWFLPVFISLSLLCGWGSVLIPHMELGRMAIALAFAATGPAALAVQRILRTRSLAMAPGRAAVLALLVLTAANVADIYGGGQRFFSTTFMGKKTDELASFIKEKALPGTRILFAGPCVHSYGDAGHIAVFPVLTGHEMMACDYYHFSPALVEYEYPPRPFRENSDRLFEFMDLYNVGLIITRSKPLHSTGVPWADRLQHDPTRYRHIATLDEGKVLVFRVANDNPSMFLRGEGSIKADFNQLHVTTSNPDQRTIIKYNWKDGLAAEPPVQIQPVTVADGVDLIEIFWNGQQECSITFDSVW